MAPAAPFKTLCFINYIYRYIDLVIPRGSNQLVSYIKKNTMIPVLGHADGICSVYVDESAIDAGNGNIITPTVAGKVVFESKTNYVSACNAVETILLHRSCVNNDDSQGQKDFFSALASSFIELNKPMEFRCDKDSLPVFQKYLTSETSPSPCKDLITVTPSTEEDYHTEFLSLTVAVKVVDSLQEAISHINSHGSGHTDCILTNSESNREQFFQGVDSADVFCNCSTRFADGFRFGFGAEIGISTNRIHARGPVGLEGLVTYKYRLYGRGHLIGELSGKDGDSNSKRKWMHESLKMRKEDGTGAKRIEDLEREYRN